MPSLAKGIPLSNLNRSNMLVSIVVFAVIIALFFIPEIIDFQRGGQQTAWSRTDQSDYLATEETTYLLDESDISEMEVSGHDYPALSDRLHLEDGELFEDEPEPVAQEGYTFSVSQEDSAATDSPLQALIYQLDDKEQVQETPQPVSLSQEEPEEQTQFGPMYEFRAALRGRRWAEEKLTRGQNRKGRQLADVWPPDGPVTWKVLNHRAVRRVVRMAQKEAMTLAKTLEVDHVQSRYALQNFIGGLGRVLKGAQKSLLPEQVPGYLAQLDEDVTKAFLNEGVARANYLKWTDISLDPLTSLDETQLSKREISKPFTPGMTLSWVKIYKPRTLYGKYKPDGPEYLGFKGYVTAKEVKHVNIYRNGELFKSLRIRRKADKKGRRIFQVHQHKLPRNSVYTFEAVDVKGKVFRKRYAFSPKVPQFVSGSSPLYKTPAKQFDPRLDRVFLTGYDNPEKENGFFGLQKSSYAAF